MSKTQAWLWSALLALVPLWYNPWSRWQYEPDKTALLLALTGLLLGHTLWRGERHALTGYRVEVGIAGFVAIRWLATTHSIAPDWSLWGDPAWRNGFWMTLAGVTLFALARRQFVMPENRERAITAILLGSALVSAYGVASYLNPFADEDVVRVASAQAHPNFLAAYLAMVMPLTALRLLASHRRAWYGGLLALQGVCLVFTYSRAGWLAAMSGLAILGIALLWRAGRRRAAGLLLTTLTAGFIALLALSLLPPLPGDAPHALQTLTSLFRWKGATARIRLLGWEASFDAIRERPWLGYGPATFRLVIERFIPPQLAPFGGGAALGGHAHNVFLEMAFESGLSGLAAYLAMLGAILIPLIRSIVVGAIHESLLPFRAAILASLIANLVNNLFSFDCAATTLLFWALAGMGHAEPATERAPVALHPRLGSLVAALSIALAALNVAPDVMARRGETLARERNWQAGVGWLDLASDIAPVPDMFETASGGFTRGGRPNRATRRSGGAARRSARNSSRDGKMWLNIR